MRNFILAFCLVFCFLASTNSFAYNVSDFFYNGETKSLEMELTFDGGNLEHHFSIEWDTPNCIEEAGGRAISGILIDSGGMDTGTNLIHQSVSIDVSNLRDCEGASFHVVTRHWQHSR